MHVLDELKARGFVRQCSNEPGLREALDAGRVSFYVGFDPTASSLHVGNLLPILMAAHLQRAGHRAVIVNGGGTGMIGDPSGKTEARQLLDVASIQSNVRSQRAILRRFIDLDDPDRGLAVDNADWLTKLELLPFLRDFGSVFSVNRMLTAEGYRQRMEKGLSFLEFSYQLLQAYDYLVLHEQHGVRLQLGGDDQWGNILAGVDLVRRKAAAEVFALTLPLLTTATGQKMGKTHAGAVWLDAERMPVFDFYQYWTNTDDRDVGRFLRLYTFLPLDEIAAYEKLEGADLREAKAALARAVTELVHGAEAAQRAAEAARAMTSATASDALPTHAVNAASLVDGVAWFAVIADAGLASSRSDARRLIEGGGVTLNGERLSDSAANLYADALPSEGIVVRVGKKRAARIVRAAE